MHFAAGRVSLPLFSFLSTRRTTAFVCVFIHRCSLVKRGLSPFYGSTWQNLSIGNLKEVPIFVGLQFGCLFLLIGACANRKSVVNYYA